MGPRGHRLHCTKRHVWVLKWSLCQQGENRERWRRSGGKTWLETWSDKTDICDISKVSHLLPAAKSSQWCSLVALWCFCIYTTREGQQEQAAHRTGQSNTNQFIPFLWKNMQSFNVCYSQCITSFFVSVYPFTVRNVFVVCACVHCVKESVRVCGDGVLSPGLFKVIHV